MKVEILEQKGNYFLWIDDFLWMWDIESERKIQYDLAHEAYGDVLVAGYGLGLVQRFLLQNKKVNSVVTIEKLIEIGNVCRQKYGKLYGSINFMDFYDFGSDIRPEIAMKYDCIIGDIWKEIVPESLDDYQRFKTHALTLVKPNGKILAWGKEYFEYLIEKGL